MNESYDQQRIAELAVEAVTTSLPGAEVVAGADRDLSALTRFATSVIHQNVATDTTVLRVRVHHDGRTTGASGVIVGAEDVAAVAARAIASVALAPLDPGWGGVATPPADDVDAQESQFDEATAHASPADRADRVAAFVDGAGGLETAGYCRTNWWRGGRATSAGWSASAEAAECALSAIARAPAADGTVADGVARHAPARLAALDGAALGARAAAKALAAADPVELAPDRYEVVLEPTAVADLLQWLCGVGFNGRSVNEGVSFARLGEPQLDPALTIVDDPLAVGQSLDPEGTVRRRLVLCDRGRTAAFTHDRRSAAEAGAVSTGHANESRFGFGPTALHATLLPAGATTDDRQLEGGADEAEGAPADASVAALVAGVRRGLLVSDFWYTRLLDPRQLTLTGLTRNGVFLIEDGELVGAVRNLRFTQSYVQALLPGNVAAVGASATATPGDTYSPSAPRSTAPALHLRSWNFTGGASG